MTISSVGSGYQLHKHKALQQPDPTADAAGNDSGTLGLSSTTDATGQIVPGSTTQAGNSSPLDLLSKLIDSLSGQSASNSSTATGSSISTTGQLSAQTKSLLLKLQEALNGSDESKGGKHGHHHGHGKIETGKAEAAKPDATTSSTDASSDPLASSQSADAQTLFKTIDSNNDGAISQTEFGAYLKQYAASLTGTAQTGNSVTI